MQGTRRFLGCCSCQSCGSDARRVKQKDFELENPQAAYWRHQWKVHGAPGFTLAGHSRALERTGFFIEEIGVYLDAGVGWRNPTSNPEAILVTHGHIDHVNALPMLLRCGDSDPAVFVPFEHVNNVREMARMTWSVKREDNVPGAGKREDIANKPAFITNLVQNTQACAESDSHWPSAADALPVDRGAIRDFVPQKAHLAGAKGRMWVPTIPGVQYLLPGKKKIIIRTVHCFHTTTDVGYVICDCAKSLCGISEEADTEYLRLKALAKTDKAAGKQIGDMRKQGLLVDREEIVPRLAYLCDTTAQVLGPCAACAAGRPGCSYLPPGSEFAESCFGYLEAPAGIPQTFDKANPNAYEDGSRNPNKFSFAAQTALLFACPTIVIECSFIGAGGMTDAQAEEEAKRRGHAAWTQIEPHAAANPQCQFVLVHFSNRYRDAEIRDYFERWLGGAGMRNVVLWLDSGVVDFQQDGDFAAPAEEVKAAAGAETES